MLHTDSDVSPQSLETMATVLENSLKMKQVKVVVRSQADDPTKLIAQFAQTHE